jgi:hypothetical protein
MGRSGSQNNQASHDSDVLQAMCQLLFVEFARLHWIVHDNRGLPAGGEMETASLKAGMKTQ